jgi:hypothetical protein
VVFPANFDFRLERMPFAIHMKEMDRTAGSTVHYKKNYFFVVPAIIEYKRISFGDNFVGPDPRSGFHT